MHLIERLVPALRRERVALTCAACGAATSLTAETMEHDGYMIHRCSACGSLSTRPLPSPETLQTYYAEYNDSYTAGMGKDRYLREMPKRWRSRIGVMQRYGARGRLLDVGGSNGMFGRIAHDHGFSVCAADYIPEPKDLGFTTVVPADMSRRGGVPFADGSYDVVTLWSCIEHVRDPDSCLAELARLTRRGGIVAIDTPLVGDACERLFAARSHWICPPEHLHLFSALGLRLAVERAGFDVLFHAPFFERNPLRWLARRGRNLAVAARGLAVRALGEGAWQQARDRAVTAAGDIQFLVARRT